MAHKPKAKHLSQESLQAGSITAAFTKKQYLSQRGRILTIRDMNVGCKSNVQRWNGKIHLTSTGPEIRLFGLKEGGLWRQTEDKVVGWHIQQLYSESSLYTQDAMYRSTYKHARLPKLLRRYVMCMRNCHVRQSIMCSITMIQLIIGIQRRERRFSPRKLFIEIQWF